MVDFSDKEGTVVLSAEIIDWVENAEKGERLARLTTTLPSLDEALHRAGHTPCHPTSKITRAMKSCIRQYSHEKSAAPPHPQQASISRPSSSSASRPKGIDLETVHLEVGLDTFRIVDEEFPKDHQIHTERYTVPEKTVEAIKRAQANGGRVIAIGTTSVRSLASAWDAEAGEVLPRQRGNQPLHPSRLRVPCGRRNGNQLPCAPLNPDDARKRILEPRQHHEGLPSRH